MDSIGFGLNLSPLKFCSRAWVPLDLIEHWFSFTVLHYYVNGFIKVSNIHMNHMCNNLFCVFFFKFQICFFLLRESERNMHTATLD